MNPKGQLVKKSDSPYYITKTSAIHTERSSTVPFQVPMNFEMALAQGLFSCPKNSRGKPVVLQICGCDRGAFVDWYCRSVAKDYACSVNSISEVRGTGCRIAFLDMGARHAADILREMKREQLNVLMVLLTDDLTALDVDGYWQCYKLRPPIETTVKQWVISGCKKYNLFDCIHPEPENQVEHLLDRFLKDQSIQPTRLTSKKKSSRMKLSELVDVLQNRARQLGMVSLQVKHIHLQKMLQQKGFTMIKPHGTRYFTFHIQ